MAKPINQTQASRALIWSNLLSEPLFTLYASLSFILYKDLGASPFQIALLTAMKPVVALLSFYWSAGLSKKKNCLKANLIWAGIWMRLPFLFCLCFDSPWFVIAAAANYMFFYRAGMPAWLEILKRNMEEKKRNHLFSLSSALGYGEGVILALAAGALLDQNPTSWKILFFFSALIGMASLCFQAKLPVEEKSEEKEKLSWKKMVLRPWQDSVLLMKERRDFSIFQWGFMLSGFGLMLIQPAIPLFAVDLLGVSYLEIAAAISIAKGLGYVLSSPLWARGINRICIFKLSSLVFFIIALFTLLFSCSVYHGVWLYIAYFFYGVGQGGSHLIWNMSGPIFSGKEESSRFSGVNVAMVGVRGLVAPPLGGVLTHFLGPTQVVLMGGFLCLYSGYRMLSKKARRVSSPSV